MHREVLTEPAAALFPSLSRFRGFYLAAPDDAEAQIITPVVTAAEIETYFEHRICEIGVTL
jgi:hypothetical protein